MKKIVALSGSPRSGLPKQKSFTEKILDLFLAGMKPTEYKKFYPHQLTINYCTGCMTCWMKTPGQCVIKDDMTAFLKTEIEEADAIILASPVYVDGFSAQIKTVLDRCFALLDPFITLDNEGHCHHERFKPKKQAAVLISTCGFSENDNFNHIRRHFAAFCRNFAWQNAGEVLVSASALGFTDDGLYDNKYKAVTKAGREFVANGRISAATMQTISEEVMKAGEYTEMVNKFFAKFKQS